MCIGVDVLYWRPCEKIYTLKGGQVGLNGKGSTEARLMVYWAVPGKR
jgi:hypothetical protein